MKKIILNLGRIACGLMLLTGLLSYIHAQETENSDFRELRVNTAEVTFPDIAVSPDGNSMIFSLLGHLFRVPETGGEAEQLTFGFSYDSEPVISPEGKRVAFISDRDGSGGNVFVLDLSNRKLIQLSHELQASSPRWSPDGGTIAYFRVLMSEELPGVSGFGSATLFEPKTIPSRGGDPAVVAPAAAFGGLFYTPDGKLGWTIPEKGSGGGMFGGPVQMRVEAREESGETILLGSIKESLGSAVMSPKGDGIFFSTDKKIKLFPFSGKKPVELASVADGSTRLGVAANDSALCFGDRGKLWRVRLPDGKPEAVPFIAKAVLKGRKRVDPNWTPVKPGPVSPRVIISPQISQDQKKLVFMAAGFLFEQSLDEKGGPAKRILKGDEFERDPAVSPDGKKLAYAISRNGKRELRVFDFETVRERTLYTVGGASWVRLPGWSPDGKQLVFQRSDGLSEPHRLIRVDLDGGASEELAQTRGSWTARPHFSADGQALYFTARTGKYAAFYRLSLQKGAKPEALSELNRHVCDGLVSPDGNWLAFRTNTKIWIASLATLPVREKDLRMLTDDCSRSFFFAPDSEAVIYAGGNHVWRQPLTGGQRLPVPIRLTLQHRFSEPLLIRNIKVLDYSLGRFTEYSSMMIEKGKILWIGSERDHDVPKGIQVLDGGGRYAIPGLFDVHVHSAWANEAADEDVFIAFGNTSVRDVGASLDILNAFRDRGDGTFLPAPRFWCSGEILEGAMPLWGDAFLQITDEEDARLAVRKWKEWGADWIKVYLTVPWHLQNIMAQEAHRQGLPVAGHAISFEEIVRHTLQGYASVEHTTAVIHEDGRKLMAVAGTRWVATLTCEGGSEIFMREDPPEHMDSDLVRAFVPPEKIKTALKGGRLSYSPKEYWPVSMNGAFSRIFAAYRDGVKVRAGTDAMMAEVFFGLSLHWEIEFFNMAGLSALEALKTATLGGAETVGAASYLGTLTPGKFADLVILDADPLQNIRNTTQIWRVIKEGILFDPRTLRPSASE